MRLNNIKIKPPKELGKLKYVQNFDVKQEFVASLFFRIFNIVFALFGCVIAISLILTGVKESNIFLIIASVFFGWFFIFLYSSIVNFFIIEQFAVFDKGLARYDLSLFGGIKNSKILNFKDVVSCIYEEGFEDPNSVVAKRFRIKAKWILNSGKTFNIIYTPKDLKNKQALSEAILAYKFFTLNNAH